MGRVFGRAVLLLAVLGVLVGVGREVALDLFQAPGPSRADTTVVLPKGAGLTAIADRLAAAGVVGKPLVFVIGVRLEGAQGRLQAGEYLFPAGISAAGAMAMLVDGQTVVRRVTVPEGLTSREIIDLVALAEGLKGEVVAVPPEGSLLPETYHYALDDERGDVVRRMEEAMAAKLAEVWAGRDPSLPLVSPAELVTLASIVEKETGVPEERARIAGVFFNRLRLGMPLQSDPTVVYALTLGQGPLGRSLSRDDLEIANPYNTYVNGGLPPGPIANPGVDALAAVAHPQATDELYFVADGTGGHAFAATLAEHNRNVAAWRKVQAATSP